MLNIFIAIPKKKRKENEGLGEMEAADIYETISSACYNTCKKVPYVCISYSYRLIFIND